MMWLLLIIMFLVLQDFFELKEKPRRRKRGKKLC